MEAQSPQEPSRRSMHISAGASRRLLLERLREIDALTEKELRALKNDANKFKNAFKKRIKRKKTD